METFLGVLAVLGIIVVACLLISILAGISKFVNAKAALAEESYNQLYQENTNYWKGSGKVRYKRDW